MARVLVLDGHTNQALACVRSLAQAAHEVLVGSEWRLPLAAWSRFCRGTFHVRAQTAESFSAIREWAESEKVEIVLPLTERSCRLCNHTRAEWERGGITIACGPDAMLMLAFDKAATVHLASACGVAIPQTRFPESDEECVASAVALGWPCVVKPRFSHSWDGRTFLPDRGCAYASEVDALRKAVTLRRQAGAWPMIQACVAGTGRGVFALCDRGRVVAWFAHERLRDVQPTGSGSSLRRSIALDDRLRQPAARLLAAMEWHGPAMVEFRDDGGSTPVLMEVNGRFWNSLQLAVDAGVDFPRMWIDLLTGGSVPPVSSYTEGVTSRWLWGDVKRFLRIAAGPPSGYTGPYPSRWQGVTELFGPQPSGTRLEVWRPSDPWPAMGEWIQGVQEVMTHG
ncbi:MAG: hypothetical protein EHM55_01625 [Acidobacteria bacterium]|nr:MAG: hypothetical protein EHM55_01625 [Acidobacteriota bacterium]